MAYRVESCFLQLSVLLDIYKRWSAIPLAVPLAPKVRIAINPVHYDAHIVQLARTAQPRPRHRPSRVPYAPLAHSATTQEQLTFQRALNVCRGRKARRQDHWNATHARLERMPSLGGSKRAIIAELDLF